MTRAAFTRAWRGVWAMARKELTQLRRDRLTLSLLFGVPLAQLLLFGSAIELRPQQLPAAWVLAAGGPADDSPQERQARAMVLTQLRDHGALEVPDAPVSAALAAEQLRRGEVQLVLTLPTHLRQTWLLGEPLDIGLEVNLSNPHALPLLGVLGDRLGAGLARAVQASAQQGGTVALTVPPRLGQHHGLRLQVQGLWPLSASSGAYLVPALSGVVLTLTLTLVAALCVVREVERGTWDSLRTTPLTSGQIVMGKLLPYWALGLLLYALLQAVAAVAFGTAWASPALWALAACFMWGQLGLGLVLSLVARQQLQAMQMGIFFFLPAVLLSGFMFPFEAMPRWAQGVGELLPLTHFLRAMRAELFHGAPAATVWAVGWPVLLFACSTLVVAWWGYRRRVGA